jgi:predicted PhzF superfamily epimerase YddE/YHI9
VPVRSEEEWTYAAGRPEWSPGFEFVQVSSPDEVEALDGPPEGGPAEVGVWAWIDEDAGIVRERVFAEEYGIPEDEATGSAAVVLAARLGRVLDVRQGRGSRILARPLDDGMVQIAGRVALDEAREYSPELGDEHR